MTPSIRLPSDCQGLCRACVIDCPTYKRISRSEGAHDAMADGLALYYLLAIVCVLAALIVREVLVAVFGMTFSGVTFYPSVLVTALIGGMLPSLFATGLSTFLLWFVVLPPRFALSVPEPSHAADLVLFVVVNLIIAAVGTHHRQLRMREREEKNLLEFTLAESEFTLAESTHRVKNILAVIKGISRQIGDRASNLTEFQEAFYDRLQSIARCHDLLVKHEWNSVDLRELVITQLNTFKERSSININGDAIRLTPTAAEQLGLALYELGSNSIKHGAWKEGGTGAVSIKWQLLHDGALEFVWDEHGVPRMGQGERMGFGRLVLTEVVPRNVGGHSVFTKAADGVQYRLCIPRPYLYLEKQRL